jgi:hypothetical protein
MSIANLKGDIETLDWTNGPTAPVLEDSVIELYNLKSKYKVFGIFPEDTRLVTTGWFNREQSPHTPDPFAGVWNHWPVSQLLSDGRLAAAYDRMTSCALGERRRVTKLNIGMYGFTEHTVSSLVPLARSWNHPAMPEEVKGATIPLYNAEQRAYELEAFGGKISFTLNASEQSPVVNPAFVISNWGSADPRVKIDGQTVTSGVRQGHVMGPGEDTLILFIERSSTTSIRLELANGHLNKSTD